MCNKNNLPNRVTKAKAATNFIGVVSNGKRTTYSVPGSQGKQYRVKIRRNGSLSVQCWLEANQADCAGNANGTVCYHGMAVCEKLAADAGKSIVWCASQPDAERLARIGGKVFKVKSHQSGSTMYGVCK